MLSTVAVTSRWAYMILSAGTRASVWPTIQQPTEVRILRILWELWRTVKPGMDSSLSRVPPVKPRPRPDIMGTWGKNRGIDCKFYKMMSAHTCRPIISTKRILFWENASLKLNIWWQLQADVGLPYMHIHEHIKYKVYVVEQIKYPRFYFPYMMSID